MNVFVKIFVNDYQWFIITGAAAGLVVISILYFHFGNLRKVFRATTTEVNIEMGVRPRNRTKKKSDGIPWNILVVPWKRNKKLQMRKCKAKYAKCHEDENFQKNILLRMELLQKTSDYKMLKMHNNHVYNVSFDFDSSEISLALELGTAQLRTKENINI